jgi:hypothetical protein
MMKISRSIPTFDVKGSVVDRDDDAEVEIEVGFDRDAVSDVDMQQSGY